jgi:hypothetical protein
MIVNLLSMKEGEHEDEDEEDESDYEVSAKPTRYDSLAVVTTNWTGIE